MTDAACDEPFTRKLLEKAVSYRLVMCSISCIALLGATGAADAATTTYTYDALGRLVQVDVSGGAQHGVRRSFQYDPAGNRLQAKTSSWLPTSITPTTTTLNFVGAGDIVLRVNVGDSNATGTVSFSFNGVFFGSAQVINGVAQIGFQGVAPGDYTVTATYSGDAYHQPNTVTFDVKVQDLSWLPAVLDLILQ